LAGATSNAHIAIWKDRRIGGNVCRLPSDAVVRAINECEALGVGQITFTGGEPLLYLALDRVLQAAAMVPKATITVCTNGTLLTACRAARFRELNLKVNISVDGRPDYHDQFRRSPGAFLATETGVRAAVKSDIPVTIISTISRDNLHDLEFLVDWASNIGADHCYVQPLLDLGRGRQIAGHCLAFQELNRLIFQLSDIANRPQYRPLHCQIIGAKRKFLLEHPCGAFVRNGTHCHRGVSKEIRKLVVREDGTVLPEVPNLSSNFLLANICDGSLSDLIDRHFEQGIDRYFEQGYDEFDRLCRTTYRRVLPDWDCVIVPWEQILSVRSEDWRPGEADAIDAPGCVSCAVSRFGARNGSTGDNDATFCAEAAGGLVA
jgi:Fe-coproporphyrin III synthase